MTDKEIIEGNKIKTIVVWFSCGVASAVGLKKTVEIYGHDYIIRAVNNPVKEEDDDNRRFLKDIEKWAGVEIELAINPKYPSCSAEDVWIDRKYMSGLHGAPCTIELKKEARYLWELTNNPDFHVLGFTFDEQGRFKRFKLGARLVRYKGKRIFLDELPSDAKGRDMKKMTIECGIFCDINLSIPRLPGTTPNPPKLLNK